MGSGLDLCIGVHRSRPDPRQTAAAEGAAAAVSGGEEKGTDLSAPCVRQRPRASLPPTVPFVETVPLTSLARAGGCAAKYAAGRLETLLAGLVPAEAEDLLVGLDPADDAAVYRLDADRAIVFTVDFFPPLVDDPRTFGAIAATNALNDVFAMGGTPLLALSIAAFPEELPTEVLGDMLAGADERVRAAGAILAGGHTIRDAEPKYGLAVVGTVHPDAIWPKAGARSGDALFLTKPLGTGIVLQARARRHGTPGALDAAVASMVELNKAAAEALRPFAPNAVTDVTGFGLLGHAARARVAKRRARDRRRSRPPAAPGRARARGGRRSDRRRSQKPRVREPHVESYANAALEALAYDPQTAGGLLVSMPAERGRRSRGDVPAEGLLLARIGHVEGRSRSRARASERRCQSHARVLSRTRVPPAWHSHRAIALFLVVTSGAFVRLTGSGLGCENWPRCGDKPYPEQGFHAFVEFGNRMVALVGIVLTLVTWLGVAESGRSLAHATWAALGAFLVAAAQIPMGGITIALDLHPLAVMTHFLLGLTVVAFSAIVVLEAWSLVAGLASPAGPLWLRKFVSWVGLPTCAATRRHRRRCHRLGPTPGLERRCRAARHRDHGDGVRPRARRGGVRNRGAGRRRAALASAPQLPRASFGSGASCSSRSSRRRSSVRSSTETRCPGASCSSTSSWRRRSGR